MNRQSEHTGTIRVLIVDDEADLRMLVRMMLSIDTRFDIVGEAANGGEGLELYGQLRPDVLILDQRMPVLEGLQLAERVLADHPDQVVILMSAYLDEAIISDAIALGVRSVMGKQDLADIVDEILRLVD